MVYSTAKVLEFLHSLHKGLVLPDIQNKLHLSHLLIQVHFLTPVLHLRLTVTRAGPETPLVCACRSLGTVSGGTDHPSGYTPGTSNDFTGSDHVACPVCKPSPSTLTLDRTLKSGHGGRKPRRYPNPLPRSTPLRYEPRYSCGLSSCCAKGRTLTLFRCDYVDEDKCSFNDDIKVWTHKMSCQKVTTYIP